MGIKYYARKTVIILLLLSGAALADTAPKKYVPVTRPHTVKEKVFDFSLCYAALWAGFAVTQPEEFSKISWEKFDHNIFHIGAVFMDESNAMTNFVGHPYVGSEYYLYFRSRGYSTMWSMVNGAIVSTMFEEFIETGSEPFSGIDFLVTPLVGGPIGWAREKAGLRLVNSDIKFYRVVGHVLYLETNFWFFEDAGFVPVVSTDGGFSGLNFAAKF